jgi:hypothetical protein
MYTPNRQNKNLTKVSRYTVYPSPLIRNNIEIFSNKKQKKQDKIPQTAYVHAQSGAYR